MSERNLKLSAEMLVDAAILMSPAVSPDGHRVAYAVGRRGPDKRRFTELWVAAADAAPARLATGLRRVGSLRWSADSESLLFIMDQQVHRMRADAGGAGAEALTSWEAGISDQLPLADGRSVAVLAEDEPTEEDARREAEGDDAIVWGRHVPIERLRLLDLDSGRLRTMDGLGDRHVVAVAGRPDGGALAVITWDVALDDPGNCTARLHVVDPASGKARDLGAISGVDACSPVWWKSEDTWHVAYIAMPADTSVGFAVFDVAVSDDAVSGDAISGDEGERGHRDLTAGMPACPVELAQVDDGPPVALFAEGLDTAVYRLEPATMRFGRLLLEQGGLDMLSVDGSGSVIAVRKTTPEEPKEIYAGTVHGPLTRLSDVRPEFRQVAWGGRERLAYQAADGLELQGLLILPPGRTRQDGPFPLITWVHGGPYGRHVDELVDINEPPGAQWLAAAGYAVFLPNPRGSLGRGAEFAKLVRGAVGQGEWTDILGGIDVLVAEGVADPDRLGIGGWSHGGFLAAWAVGRSDRFKAALMGAGISDWGLQVGLGELGVQEVDLTGSCGWESPGPHRHDQLSPISYAANVRTPVLMLHGEQDQNVPLGQAVYFHRALRHYGVEHEFVVYPREGHGVGERGHQLDVMRRSVAWFDRWLGASSNA